MPDVEIGKRGFKQPGLLLPWVWRRGEFLATQVSRYWRLTALNGLMIQSFRIKCWDAPREGKAEARAL